MRKQINISVDSELLEKIDQYADDNYTTRSGVFTQGAVQVIRANELMRAVADIATSIRKISDNGLVDDQTLRQLEDYERLCKMFAGQ